MGKQIIEQPNGKYALWSSICDNFILLDATELDIIEELVAESRDDIERNVKRIIASLNAGGKPYYQFTKTWSEALSSIEDVDDVAEIRKIGEEVIHESYDGA